jgi:RimJ/RimL family protein N-acetyltransferase
VNWPTLTTERLLLRPLATDDLDALVELHAEESFWHYPFKRGWTRNETSAFLERTISRYEDPGLAVSAVVVADTGELAGWAGLSVPTFLPSILPAVEVGWRLGSRYRGRGYATEAGRAWVHHGFDQLDLDTIVSIYEPANVASGAVMRRLGFTLEREAVHPTLDIPLHVMSLARAAR